eukprot:UN02127
MMVAAAQKSMMENDDPSQNKAEDDYEYLYSDKIGDSTRPFKDYSSAYLYLLCKTNKIIEVHEELLIREIMKVDELDENWSFENCQTDI